MDIINVKFFKNILQMIFNLVSAEHFKLNTAFTANGSQVQFVRIEYFSVYRLIRLIMQCATYIITIVILQLNYIK